MRTIFSCLPILALLAACSVVPPQAWTFDPTLPPPKATLTTAELAALTDQVAQLQIERNEIRARIATEPHAWKRQDYYAQLHRVGMELSPLERRLASAVLSR